MNIAVAAVEARRLQQGIRAPGSIDRGAVRLRVDVGQVKKGVAGVLGDARRGRVAPER